MSCISHNYSLTKTMRSIGFLLGLAALTNSAACDRVNDGDSASMPTRRDSTGIEIVENALPSGKTRVAFVVAADAAVDIGLREGDVNYLLNEVKGVARLSDGRIVIAEFNPAVFRFYDSTGRHLITRSIHGEGPGEVEAIQSMVPHRGDSLLIKCCTSSGGLALSGGQLSGNLMPRAMRTQISVYDSGGRMGRRADLSWPDTPSKVTMRGDRRSTLVNGDPWKGFQAGAADGSFIIRGGAWAQLEGKPGTRWVTVPYFRIPAEASRADTMIMLPTIDKEEDPDANVVERIPNFYRNPPPVALYDNWMLWGNPDSFEIQVFDLNATATRLRPARIIRYALPNRPVDDQLRERYLDLMLRLQRNKEDSLATVEAEKARPARPTLPAFQTLRVDQSGNLWVEHTRLSNYPGRELDNTEQQTWTVFDPSGALLGDVITPAGLAIAQIGNGWILGVWKDSDDVEHVKLYRLGAPGR
jgi:hypothetical protein